MNYTLKNITLSIAAGVLMVFAGSAAAAGELTKDDVKAKLEAAGYTNVGQVRRERNHYDATAIKDGKKVMLDVDATTGAITPEDESDEREEHEEHHEAKHK